jgi:adenosylhomocysteinase
MISFEQDKLQVTKDILTHSPKMTIVAILHALSDTEEFLSHLVQMGHEVSVIFAKPFSKNTDVIARIERTGIRVEQLDYDALENTSILKETITQQLEQASYPLVLIDVGGYFAQPLIELSKQQKPLPAGVVEVTTFGHNKYEDAKQQIKVPIVSIARSELKDMEATFVGESAWLAADRVLREVGVSAHGNTVGIVGYGMIGRRVAATAKAHGVHTLVYDTDTLKLLNARSHNHAVTLTMKELMTQSDIVISATGTQAISLADVLSAKDGIVLASAGSKANEINMDGLRNHAKGSKDLSSMLTRYTMEFGKKVLIMRDGAAINFLIGSCPDATMDLVFAELAEGCTAIVKNDLALHTLNEVSNAVRQCIAKSWLSMQ